MSIIHTFFEWVWGVFGPCSGGRHRARPTTTPAPDAAYPRPVQGPVRAPRRPAPRRLPRVRSPYGLGTALDGHEVALVRPYLVAYEERQQQPEQQRERVLRAERCRVLLLALDGVDVGPEWIHGVRVGAAR